MSRKRVLKRFIWRSFMDRCLPITGGSLAALISGSGPLATKPSNHW